MEKILLIIALQLAYAMKNPRFHGETGDFWFRPLSYTRGRLARLFCRSSSAYGTSCSEPLR